MNVDAQNYLVLFVNLFFPAFICLYFFIRRKNAKKSVPLLIPMIFCRYGIYVVANLILTHILVVAIRTTKHTIVYNSGVTYTVLAASSAIAISVFEGIFLADEADAADEAEKTEESDDL